MRRVGIAVMALVGCYRQQDATCGGGALSACFADVSGDAPHPIDASVDVAGDSSIDGPIDSIAIDVPSAIDGAIDSALADAGNCVGTLIQVCPPSPGVPVTLSGSIDSDMDNRCQTIVQLGGT